MYTPSLDIASKLYRITGICLVIYYLAVLVTRKWTDDNVRVLTRNIVKTLCISAVLYYIFQTISLNTLFLYDDLGVDITKPNQPVDINLALEQTRQALCTLKGVAYYLLQVGFFIAVMRVMFPSFPALSEKAPFWLKRKGTAATGVSE
jgi:hypothetical protein